MKKRKKGYGLWLLCLCMIFLCTTCGKETGKTEEGNPQETEETKAQSQKEITLPEEAPEGYVYDYQVSMKPIPKEIADLGGPCVGTMHAFPTRIEMALTQQEVEKDPELKAEVEKCTQEVKDALTEEVGGEFEVQVMSMDEDKLNWTFFCKEVSTGYEFTMGYSNYRYNDPETRLDNHIYVEEYYDKLDGEKYEKDIKEIIKSIFEDESSSVYGQRGSGETFEIDVAIAQFVDVAPNKMQEQKKLLELWKRLKEYNDKMWYRIDICYYPLEYQKMISNKYELRIFEDIYIGSQREGICKLMDNREIYSYFCFDELFNKDDVNSVNNMLSSYQSGTYDENQIWDYWIGG